MGLIGREALSTCKASVCGSVSAFVLFLSGWLTEAAGCCDHVGLPGLFLPCPAPSRPLSLPEPSLPIQATVSANRQLKNWLKA